MNEKSKQKRMKEKKPTTLHFQFYYNIIDPKQHFHELVVP
jgi:hypothetical protein